MDLKRGIDKAVAEIVKNLKSISKEVGQDASKIKQIATISANNDETIGKLISEAMKVVGNDGAGIVLGARVRVILTSRAGNTEARNASSALALVYFRNRESRGIKV